MTPHLFQQPLNLRNRRLLSPIFSQTTLCASHTKDVRWLTQITRVTRAMPEAKRGIFNSYAVTCRPS